MTDPYQSYDMESYEPNQGVEEDYSSVYFEGDTGVDYSQQNQTQNSESVCVIQFNSKPKSKYPPDLPDLVESSSDESDNDDDDQNTLSVLFK